MSNKTQSDRYGGHEFHVADCYVWAEIYYLDSATDYREYLRTKDPPVQFNPRGGQMVLLDNGTCPHFLKSLGQFLFYLSIIAAVIVFVIAIAQD